MPMLLVSKNGREVSVVTVVDKCVHVTLLFEWHCSSLCWQQSNLSKLYIRKTVQALCQSIIHATCIL